MPQPYTQHEGTEDTEKSNSGKYYGGEFGHQARQIT
jgi:hypothetical protein